MKCLLDSETIKVEEGQSLKCECGKYSYFKSHGWYKYPKDEYTALVRKIQENRKKDLEAKGK